MGREVANVHLATRGRRSRSCPISPTNPRTGQGFDPGGPHRRGAQDGKTGAVTVV